MVVYSWLLIQPAKGSPKLVPSESCILVPEL